MFNVQELEYYLLHSSQTVYIIAQVNPLKFFIRKDGSSDARLIIYNTSFLKQYYFIASNLFVFLLIQYPLHIFSPILLNFFLIIKENSLLPRLSNITSPANNYILDLCCQITQIFGKDQQSTPCLGMVKPVEPTTPTMKSRPFTLIYSLSISTNPNMTLIRVVEALQLIIQIVTIPLHLMVKIQTPLVPSNHYLQGYNWFWKGCGPSQVNKKNLKLSFR